MATSKKQRAGILIIVVATVLGTLGSFAVMILSMQSNKQAQADYQKVLSEYKKEQTAYEQKNKRKPMNYQPNITRRSSSILAKLQSSKSIASNR